MKYVLTSCMALAFWACTVNHHEEPLAIKIQRYTDSVYYSGVRSTDLAGAELNVVGGDTMQAFVRTRRGQIKKYPCIECHKDPMSVLQSKTKNTKRAHWDIQLVHAPQQTMQCKTCHSYDNLDELVYLQPGKMQYSESYALCGQCHSKQLVDWRGGAHGKRVGGWAPPRVMTNCVECHDPHRPRFDTRWPAEPSLRMEKIIER